MTIEIRMPALSPTMTEGTLAKWHKKEGEEVASGDVIAEIETDKATMEVEAVDEGRLGRILVKEGTEGVAVNAPIAILLEEGEEESALDAAAARPEKKAEPKREEPEVKPEVRKAEATEDQPPQKPEPKAEAPRAEQKQPAGAEDGDRLFASPLARRMAAQAGVGLASLKGSGPHGRIVKADVEAAMKGVPAAPAAPEPPAAREETRPAPQAPAAAPAARKPAAGLPDELYPPYKDIPHSTMRRVIARRMQESKRDAPHFYLTVDCRIDDLMKVRQRLNDRAPAEGPEAYKLSLNDLVIKVASLALLKVPAANAAWTEGAIRRFEWVDMSVAVAIEGGLITPVIRQADRKGLVQISREMKDLATRARAGKLKPEEYQGGTFSISNLGMYGIREFGAVVNPPQGAILAVGAGEQRPVVKDGALAIATMMTCTLSVDHRSVDGAVGAEYLQAFKRLIEDPLAMLL